VKSHYEIAVIGAGPAGLAAALEAAEAGAEVALFDEQPGPGGQIYRAIENPAPAQTGILGEEYRQGRPLVEQLRGAPVDYLSGTTVWQVSAEREIGVSRNGTAQLVSAGQIILATGALERPFPVAGWTLPGVSTVGGAQILLKTAGVVADGAVLAGTGPLLYLVANQYLRAGVSMAALLDTTPPGNRWRALRHLPGALARFDLLAKGQGWIRNIQRSGTPFIRGVTELSIEGDSRVAAVNFQTATGVRRRIETEHVFLHQGVVPNVNLSMAAGCAHEWDSAQICWRPQTDGWGETSLPGIAVAGDGAGIFGAQAAEHAGRIAALGALARLGRLSGENSHRRCKPHRLALARERKARPFIDALFRPGKSFRIPRQPDTLVCRCEEVTAGRIRETVAAGCAGPNQLKAFCRAGMGPCQGRFCGLTVSELIAEETGRPMAEVGYYRLRPPVKPLLLEELANLDSPAAE
jgi:NADPH-dependent 2,4-dienoyl-CoA reductase/sulfur reductase-like enzyme